MKKLNNKLFVFAPWPFITLAILLPKITYSQNTKITQSTKSLTQPSKNSIPSLTNSTGSGGTDQGFYSNLPTIATALGQLNQSEQKGQRVTQMASQIAFMNSASFIPPCTSGFASACKQAALWALGGVISLQVSGLFGKSQKTSAQGLHEIGTDPLYFQSTTHHPTQEQTSLRDLNQANKTLHESLPFTAEQKKIIEDVCRTTKMCIDPEKNRLTLPNGTSVPLNQIDDQSLKQAGLLDSNSSLQNWFDKLIEQANNEVTQEPSSTKSNSGSLLHSPQPKSSQTNQLGSWEEEETMLSDSPHFRQPASAVMSNDQPLTKIFQGEPIAVAQENIFDLIHRRYEMKAKQEELLLHPINP